MPTMPNVVGLELETAQNTLQSAGVIDPSYIGYFGTWPITVTWQNLPLGAGVVSSQSPIQGTMVAANSAINLTCASFPFSVSYP